jgi:hypothetical protein
MNFLYPGFLFALLAVAIPILIHLFNFRKFKRVYFSNVQFLKEAKEQGTAKEKLKHRLLLASRILAVAFLVLAFAQPFIPSGTAAKKESDSNVISIYVDNSYSMETVNKEGSLLDEARRRAKEIAKGYGVNDRFQLITNDFEGQHQRLVNREEFYSLLDALKQKPATGLKPGIRFFECEHEQNQLPDLGLPEKFPGQSASCSRSGCKHQPH